MPDMYEALRTSFESQQNLAEHEGRTAAGAKHAQETRDLEDEIARIEQQQIASKTQYAKAGRDAQKQSSHAFWTDLVKNVALEMMLHTVTGGLTGAAGIVGKGAKAYQAFRKGKVGKNIIRGLMLAESAADATRAGQKKLATELEKAPKDIRFIEEPGSEFLGQERKRAKEAVAGAERERKTMKDMLEGVYEGMGKGRMEMKALSPSGIKQMMAGAQAFGYADTLLNLAEFAKVFGSKQSVVGEEALGSALQFESQGKGFGALNVKDLHQPSFSPFRSDARTWQEVVSQADKLQLPDLASQAAPIAGQAAGAGAALPSMSQMFGGGLGGQLPSLGQVGSYSPFQSLSGQEGGPALQVLQKLHLKPYAYQRPEFTGLEPTFDINRGPFGASLGRS